MGASPEPALGMGVQRGVPVPPVSGVTAARPTTPADRCGKRLGARAAMPVTAMSVSVTVGVVVGTMVLELRLLVQQLVCPGALPASCRQLRPRRADALAAVRRRREVREHWTVGLGRRPGTERVVHELVGTETQRRIVVQQPEDEIQQFGVGAQGLREGVSPSSTPGADAAGAVETAALLLRPRLVRDPTGHGTETALHHREVLDVSGGLEKLASHVDLVEDARHAPHVRRVTPRRPHDRLQSAVGPGRDEVLVGALGVKACAAEVTDDPVFSNALRRLAAVEQDVLGLEVRVHQPAVEVQVLEGPPELLGQALHSLTAAVPDTEAAGLEGGTMERHNETGAVAPLEVPQHLANPRVSPGVVPRDGLENVQLELGVPAILGTQHLHRHHLIRLRVHRAQHPREVAPARLVHHPIPPIDHRLLPARKPAPAVTWR
eukprot:Hpha_TRINITY_DN15398_c0_g1::TRINITY_DN15398_c0_g1_i1::g.88566::m.88566